MGEARARWLVLGPTRAGAITPVGRGLVGLAATLGRRLGSADGGDGGLAPNARIAGVWLDLQLLEPLCCRCARDTLPRRIPRGRAGVATARAVLTVHDAFQYFERHSIFDATLSCILV